MSVDDYTAILPILPPGFHWRSSPGEVYEILDSTDNQKIYSAQHKVLLRCKDARATLDRAVWRVTGHA